MLAPTHSVFGIFLTLVILAVFGVQWSLHWSIILVAILGAIIPDIDHPKSVIGRTFPFISIPLERRYGHRTITHSFIGWGIFSLVFAFLVLFVICTLNIVWKLDVGIWNLLPRWIAAFSISYMSHLILDMFNRRGSQMFWPDPGRDVIPKNPKFRAESGSKVEVLIFIILLILLIPALPLSKYGLASSLRWLLATPGSAIEEFESQKNHSYLEFKGIFSETKAPIESKAEILATDHQRLVILFGSNIYTLSDELSADILASHVRVKRSNKPIKVEKKEFKDETYDSLLSQIPKNGLVSGTVHLPKDMIVTIPTYPGSYKAIEQKGGDLALNFASKEQIRKLGLDETFELERRKDIAELSMLKVDADKIQLQIKELEEAQGLTPLGKEMLMSKSDEEKQRIEIGILKNKLAKNDLKIEELNIKIKERKFLFSGEVYIRR